MNAVKSLPTVGVMIFVRGSMIVVGIIRDIVMVRNQPLHLNLNLARKAGRNLNQNVTSTLRNSSHGKKQKRCVMKMVET